MALSDRDSSADVNLITSIAIDTESEDEKAHYPQLAHLRSRKRREVYWECAAVFFATSVRSDQAWRRILYTNDCEPVTVRKIDVHSFLRSIGVEIRYLPFTKYKAPIHQSRTFRNNFYKLDVLSDIASHETEFSIMLDSDCVWLRRAAMVTQARNGKSLLVLDISNTSGGFRDIASMKTVAAHYKMIDNDFPSSDLRYFGGELLGGTPQILKMVSEDMHYAFSQVLAIVNSSRKGTHPISVLLQNDELISNFAFNGRPLPLFDASSFMRRIWTGPDGNVRESDLDLSLWHLPNEKNKGFRCLFDECTDDQSGFWRISSHEIPAYIGERVGVPRRMVYPRESFAQKLGALGTVMIKSVLPLKWYNLVRRAFGRSPIDSKW